jgi:orotidine-5'-phosphate decarboxylase
MELVAQLEAVVGAFKVGKELFVSAGPEVVRRIRARGASVFLDLKFHDIPNTIARAVAAAVQLDVQMLTIHASGGSQMMRAAEQAARESAAKLDRPPPLVLGVTVLTSLDGSQLSEIGLAPNVGRQVERLATLAAACGLNGLVCSPLEIAGLRQFLPSRMQLVSPGIRSADMSQDDQKRTLSPQEALAAGANWLVIGRPIYASDNPREAAERILASIEGIHQRISRSWRFRWRSMIFSAKGWFGWVRMCNTLRGSIVGDIMAIGNQPRQLLVGNLLK